MYPEIGYMAQRKNRLADEFHDVLRQMRTVDITSADALYQVCLRLQTRCEDALGLATAAIGFCHTLNEDIEELETQVPQ